VEGGEDSGPGERAVERRRYSLLFVSGAAAVILVWFALGNLHRVSIEFWVTQSRAPLILVIAISGLLGAVISALVGRRRPRQR
jgi:uncharacterized integral membrane protein